VVCPGNRDLPWRADRDPYRILVSEMMLVQRRWAAVVPYFAGSGAVPDGRGLAGADEAEVLKAWEGLGDYRRARQLHAGPARSRGSMAVSCPTTGAIRACRGRRYMAGAILSFAFDGRRRSSRRTLKACWRGCWHGRD